MIIYLYGGVNKMTLLRNEMFIQKKLIKDVAKELNISHQTLSSWLDYNNINQVIKFTNLCSILNISMVEVLEDIKKEGKHPLL